MIVEKENKSENALCCLFHTVSCLDEVPRVMYLSDFKGSLGSEEGLSEVLPRL